jgi:hypothetical protein
MKTKVTIQVTGPVNSGCSAIMRIISNTLNNVGIDTINCDPDIVFNELTQEQSVNQFKTIGKKTRVKLVRKQVNRNPGPLEFDFAKFVEDHCVEPTRKPPSFHTGSLRVLLGDCALPIRIGIFSSGKYPSEYHKLYDDNIVDVRVNADLVLEEINAHEYRIRKSRFSKNDITVCKYEMDEALYEIKLRSKSHKVLLLN